MKRIMNTLVLLSFTFLFSCEKIKGDGDMMTEIRVVDPFNGITLSLDCVVNLVTPDTVLDSGKVLHQPFPGSDSLYTVTISAQENLLKYIKTKVTGGILVISLSENKVLKKHEQIKIDLVAPDFSYININTPGTINVDLPDTVYRSFLDCNNSGPGTINLRHIRYSYLKITNSGKGLIFSDGSGFIKNARLLNQGTGRLDLFTLPADSLWCISEGSGDISVSVKNFLDGTIYKSGNIYYKSNPATVRSNITGTGKMIPL